MRSLLIKPHERRSTHGAWLSIVVFECESLLVREEGYDRSFVLLQLHRVTHSSLVCRAFIASDIYSKLFYYIMTTDIAERFSVTYPSFLVS
jgi:hypothetical protein